MRALILTLLFLCGASVAMAADAPALILEHLTKTEGLPQNTVMTTLQDSQGFVWFGTEDGLVRFDGDKLNRYAYSRTTKGSLPGNFVWDIAEDSRHDLWIATKDSGLARWNRATDTFTTYRHDPGNPSSLSSDSLRAVLVDSRDRIWIGTTDAGVDILDPKTGTFGHLRHDARVPSSLSSDRVFTLAPGRSDGVWIGTESGLNRVSSDSKDVQRHSLGGQQVSSVLEDRSGAVWAGTFEGGVTRFDSDGQVLETFRHDPTREASLRSNEVRAILEDSAGRLWIGTADGLELLDRSTHELSHYRYVPSDPESLRDSYVMSLYQDAAGLVWIGTRGGGVSRWNPRSWELGAHRPAWLGSEAVTAFEEAAGDELWISSLGGALMRFNPDTGVATSIDAVIGKRNALGGARAMSLMRDRLGALWIGTMARGLIKLTPEGRLESIPVKPGDARSLSAAGIMNIVESRDGHIWVGTYGGGANILNPASGTVRQLPHGTPSTSGSNVSAIAEDAAGNIWLGTDGGGLSLARGDGTVVKTFRHDTDDAKSLPVNTVYAVTIDAKGRVWLATDGGGLVRVVGSTDAPEKITFDAVTRAEGLTSDVVYGIVPDATGDLWLSGNSGLMRYAPDKRSLKTYHREQGLQGEEFFSGAFLRLRDGRIAFGGVGGFNVFDPQRLTENKQAPRLVLTSVEVLGVPASGPTPFWLRDNVPLDYRGSIVSLDFGVLDFSSPRHNRLAYRVRGLTDEWIDLGSQRRITLTNLDAGDHTLEVRAANADSVWSQVPLRVSIHRDPAPWKSPWAYAAYAAVLLGLVLYRVHRARVKFREMANARDRLESEVQLRTSELVESNRQLAEAARAKSDFLDRMSHELRTPMNGVVGMTELLSRTALSATQTHLTKTIRSSAQILLQIVNDLLDLSKIRAGKVQLERLPIDLGQVLEECTSLFAGAAENKGIELIVCPPARVERVLLGDPLRVRQILMNLVGNAVKFTSVGEVVVRADVDAVDDTSVMVKLRVTDTGIGMDAAAIGKIFEPFSQADETTTRKFGGTGLGLAICRELADIMGARITVDSKPQIGSTFCLSLPLAVGAEVPAPASNSRRVRIATRRASLEDSLSRHLASLGMTVAAASDAYDIVVVDASSQADELKSLLAVADSSLVVLATAAEVEALSLRVLMHEKSIVLKPVHRIALQEALAVAAGIEVASVQTRVTTRLQGHVLLVEDEAVNAAVAEGYLDELGCTSVWVKTGEEAIARNATERFDLILMDLSMPGMDGFAAVKLIRQHEAQAGGSTRIPVVALTAHDAASYRARCLAADMDEILSKPYALDDCTALLGKWLSPGSAPAPTPVLASAPPAPERSSGTTLSSIDDAAITALKKLRAGAHPNLFLKLVELFRTGSADSLSSLRTALDKRDLTAAATICHRLAASSGNVGALVYARQVRELEHLCAAGDATRVEQIYADLEAAHAPLIDALTAYTMRASA